MIPSWVEVPVEPYNAVDPVWGWTAAFYMGLPILGVFLLLLVLGLSGGVAGEVRHAAAGTVYRLYPLLRRIQKGKPVSILIPIRKT
jgi:hypothetical protein